jgi:hypothetical protein
LLLPFEADLLRPFEADLDLPFDALLLRPFEADLLRPLEAAFDLPFEAALLLPLEAALLRPLEADLLLPFEADLLRPLEALLLAFFGTFSPFSLASESPIAIACLREVTFCPLLLRSFPCFFSRITFSTFFPAPLEYLAMVFTELNG